MLVNLRKLQNMKKKKKKKVVITFEDPTKAVTHD